MPDEREIRHAENELEIAEEDALMQEEIGNPQRAEELVLRAEVLLSLARGDEDTAVSTNEKYEKLEEEALQALGSDEDMERWENEAMMFESTRGDLETKLLNMRKQQERCRIRTWTINQDKKEWNTVEQGFEAHLGLDDMRMMERWIKEHKKQHAFRKALCAKFLAGECEQGVWCPYEHKQTVNEEHTEKTTDELKKKMDEAKYNIAGESSSSGQHNPGTTNTGGSSSSGSDCKTTASNGK